MEVNLTLKMGSNVYSKSFKKSILWLFTGKVSLRRLNIAWSRKKSVLKDKTWEKHQFLIVSPDDNRYMVAKGKKIIHPW